MTGLSAERVMTVQSAGITLRMQSITALTESDEKRLRNRGFTERIPCESGHKSVRVDVDPCEGRRTPASQRSSPISSAIGPNRPQLILGRLRAVTATPDWAEE